MCGIIGYTGGQDAAGVLIRGLKRLEYRGYDSAGLAVMNGAGLEVVRAAGCVDELVKLAQPKGLAGIGHTRWATHGRPSELNAHPHRDCSGDFAVVHNGIIENHQQLRTLLEAEGHEIRSETDTEVLAHLVERAYNGNLVAAVREALAHVEGSYATAVLSNRDPGVLVAARNKSPLLVGLSDAGMFVASDATPLIEHTRKVVYLLDGELAEIRPGNLGLYNLEGKPLEYQVNEVTWSIEDAEKGGFPHYMLKEIHEIPRALQEAFRGRLGNVGETLDLEGSLTPEDLAATRRIQIFACGTSFHAGLIGKTVVERLTGIPVDVQLASEYRYARGFPGEEVLAVCVSQSGETADTLEALRKARGMGHRVLAITNVVGSTMTREAHGVLQIRAGPEIGVAATKTFTNTLVAFYLLALHLGMLLRRVTPAELNRLKSGIKALPQAARNILDRSDQLKALTADFLAREEHAFFLGRQLGFGVALEGALKLKEIAYIHAEGYAAGELKHGPFALLHAGVPVIALAPADETYPVMMSNIREVRARDARVLALVSEGDRDAPKIVDDVFRLPPVDSLLSPVPAVTALYLLCYHAAHARGCEIDRPRNLAKSVTVE